MNNPIQNPKLFACGEWHSIPLDGGMLENLGIEAQWQLSGESAWQILDLKLTNRSAQSVTLGACHLLEWDNLAGSSVDDVILLDSGGGWFAGTLRVTSRMPNCDEYWKELFMPEEDIDWAKNIQGELPGDGSHSGMSGMLVYHRHNMPALVFGFLVPSLRCSATPIVLNDPETGKVRRMALSCNFAGYELQPGETIAAESGVLGEFFDPHEGLAAWTDLCVSRRNIKLRHDRPPVGWLSWYGYRLTIDAEEINRIADFINTEYSGFGFEYMQIDLGYNKGNLPGEWFENNEHFPDGLAKFAEDMKKRGFTPGIWCGAFSVAETSRFYREHPDAVTRYPEDGAWAWEPYCNIWYLDPTHPEAAKFIRKIMRFFKSLGIHYFKIDFMNRLSRVDRFFKQYDKRKIRGAEVYRMGMMQLLDELEPDDYLYSCSNSLFHSVGMVSTSMTACDISNPGVKAKLAQGDDGLLKFFRMQMTTTMSRYYIHNKFLLLNPDSINIEPPTNLEEARFRTLFVGLSGGQVFLGDRFDLNTSEIRALVKTVLPPYGKAAVPVDMFRKPYPDMRPEIYHLYTPEREIIGLFNFDCEKNITLNWKEMKLSGEFEVWEFYEEKYLGLANTNQDFEIKVPFPTSRLLALTPKADYPQVISSSFHITQGAVELSKVCWDPQKNILSGVLQRPAGNIGNLFIKAPADLRCDLPLHTADVYRLNLMGNGGVLNWQVQFVNAL